MRVDLLSITHNSENLCEYSARVCYDSVDKMTEDSHKHFLPKVIGKGHESVIEHGYATFQISGVSRALTHQLVRHRLASYSQKSQRFVGEKMFDYVIPPAIKNDHISNLMYRDMMTNIQELYDALIDRGIRKEDARFVLPNACTSDIIVSMNFRSWRHFCELRCHKAAQWEIRELAHRILYILGQEAPSIFGDLVDKYTENNNG